MAAETLKYFYFFDISNMTIACLHIVDIWRESILQLTYFSFHLSTFAKVKKVNESNMASKFTNIFKGFWNQVLKQP